MTSKQLTQARRLIRQHYGLDRRVTEQEAIDEIGSLKRKAEKGRLDDMDERLVTALSVGKYGIKIEWEHGIPPMSVRAAEARLAVAASRM